MVWMDLMRGPICSIDKGIQGNVPDVDDHCGHTIDKM